MGTTAAPYETALPDPASLGADRVCLHIEAHEGGRGDVVLEHGDLTVRLEGIARDVETERQVVVLAAGRRGLKVLDPPGWEQNDRGWCVYLVPA